MTYYIVVSFVSSYSYSRFTFFRMNATFFAFTRKPARSELPRLLCNLVCSLMSLGNQMSALQPLGFLQGSLHYKLFHREWKPQ